MKCTSCLIINLLSIIGIITYGCTAQEEHDITIFENITSQEAAELINDNYNNANFVIIDVRTIGEFDSGHIKGALNLDYYSDDFQDELYKLDKGKTYFVYCASGNRSGKAMTTMESLGFTKVYNLSGGITDLISEGLSVVE